MRTHHPSERLSPPAPAPLTTPASLFGIKWQPLADGCPDFCADFAESTILDHDELLRAMALDLDHGIDPVEAESFLRVYYAHSPVPVTLEDYAGLYDNDLDGTLPRPPASSHTAIIAAVYLVHHELIDTALREAEL